MKQRLHDWLARIDAMGVRERALLLAVVLVMLLLGFDLLAYRSNSQAITSGEERLQALQLESQQTQAQLTVLQAQLAEDPDEPLRERLQQLADQHRAMTQALTEQAGGLISPRQMRELLQSMLEASEGLSLRSVKNQPARPVVAGTMDLNQADDAMYEHRLELQFCGAYLDVLDYLQRLEQLPWGLVWQRFSMSNEAEQPCFVLGVATFSFEEDALGV
jgi:MSHA biogenesis protein MshJ